jgi:hypothetical protein
MPQHNAATFTRKQSLRRSASKQFILHHYIRPFLASYFTRRGICCLICFRAVVTICFR